MVQALLKIRDLVFQTFQEAFGNLPEEHAGFTDGIKKARFRIAEKFLRKHVQNFINNIRRRKNLLLSQIL